MDDKRIVLEHRAGRLKGVHSIVGLQSEAPNPLPEFVPEVDLQDHTAPTCLVGVKRSYVLYREVVEPEKQNGKNFNEAQR
jgi:hypothetical protein